MRKMGIYGRIFTRTISLCSRQSAKNYYESLELKPNATQAEIKDAFYKLSMQYHPDKNSSIEASSKFKDIAEAYECLRNVRLRKLYDKGFFSNRTGPSTVNVDEEVDKFYRSRQNKSKPPPPTGRTPIYDFDEWSKSHYGATLARDLRRKHRREADKVYENQAIDHTKNERVLASILAVTLMVFYFLYRHEDFDDVRTDSGK